MAAEGQIDTIGAAFEAMSFVRTLQIQLGNSSVA